MPLPLFIWGGILLVGAAAGTAGTLAVTDSFDDFGDAAEKTGDAVAKITKAVLLAGTAYVAYQNRDLIIKGVRELVK